MLKSSLLLTFIGTTLAFGLGCTTVPENKVTWHKWPKGVFHGVPDRQFEKLGQVRTRIEYNSLDFENDENKLCKNYFNKAANDLLKRAKKVGADAVIDVKAVVFQIDGKTETYDNPECTDDGVEGQVLAQGVAVRWKRTSDGKILGGTPDEVKARAYAKAHPEKKIASRVLAPATPPKSALERQPASSSEQSSSSKSADSSDPNAFKPHIN